MATRTGLSRRSAFLGGAGAAILLRAPAVLGQAKSKFSGTTIRGAAFSLPFHEYLRKYFAEFEERTGIKIAFDIQAFPVYNQRMDLELSIYYELFKTHDRREGVASFNEKRTPNFEGR